MASVQSQDACPTCDSSEAIRKVCRYESTIKFFDGCHTRGYWSVGSDKILKEMPYQPDTCEMLNQQFVKDNTQIPFAPIVKEWVDDNSRRFVLVERAKGQTLEKAWPTLSSSEKESVAEEVAECLQQLRKFQSPRMESLEHKRLHTYLLFFAGHEGVHGPFTTDAEIWNAFETSLANVPKEMMERLKTHMPRVTPFTFTHAGLNLDNIIVHDGKLSAILSWEGAGYFPVWWEFAAAGIGHTKDDLEWKRLLMGKMGDKYMEAREFIKYVWALHHYPDFTEEDQELVTKLMKSEEE